jgi:hypothetical protein
MVHLSLFGVEKLLLKRSSLWSFIGHSRRRESFSKIAWVVSHDSFLFSLYLRHAALPLYIVFFLFINEKRVGRGLPYRSTKKRRERIAGIDRVVDSVGHRRMEAAMTLVLVGTILK